MGQVCDDLRLGRTPRRLDVAAMFATKEVRLRVAFCASLSGNALGALLGAFVGDVDLGFC